MTPEFGLLLVVAFLALLVIGDLVLGRVLDTDAHKDARTRNRHDDLGERWWRA